LRVVSADHFAPLTPVLCFGHRYGITLGRLRYMSKSPCDCPGDLPHRVVVSVRWPDGSEDWVALPHISVLRN
jgi:hypothetical protein